MSDKQIVTHLNTPDARNKHREDLLKLENELINQNKKLESLSFIDGLQYHYSTSSHLVKMAMLIPFLRLYYYFKFKKEQQNEFNIMTSVMGQVGEQTGVDENNEPIYADSKFLQLMLDYKFVKSNHDNSFSCLTVIPTEVVHQLPTLSERGKFVSTIVDNKFIRIYDELAQGGVLDIMCLEHIPLKANAVRSTIFPKSIVKFNEMRERKTVIISWFFTLFFTILINIILVLIYNLIIYLL